MSDDQLNDLMAPFMGPILDAAQRHTPAQRREAIAVVMHLPGHDPETVAKWATRQEVIQRLMVQGRPDLARMVNRLAVPGPTQAAVLLISTTRSSTMTLNRADEEVGEPCLEGRWGLGKTGRA